MSEFQTPVDIGNRGLMHCGVPRMDPTLGFTEDSTRASAVSFVYGKLRRAELQRNFWTFAIKKAALRAIDVNTMLLAASLWVQSTTYFVGSIASDDQGNLWISRQPNNLGNDPQNTPAWEPYFGPLTADPYDATTTYFAGELVYTAAGDGTNRVFVSLINGNADNPATATAWSATATYAKNQVVAYASVAYMSLIDLNTNNTPSAAPALFNIATTYASGNRVGGSDGVIYQSLANGNVGHDPTLDAGVHWQNTGVLNPWTTVFTGGSGSLNWLEIGGSEFPSGVTLSTLNIVYPLGAGPSSQGSTRNAFKLPSNFLREAPQDPKAGSFSYLGAPGNLFYDDWLFESGYLVSACSGVIVLRFVADVQDVRLMHDMFCEGLGARVGLEICEEVTQSTAKKQDIKADYLKFMSEARTVNAIEAGAEEAPLDDYLACRF